MADQAETHLVIAGYQMIARPSVIYQPDYQPTDMNNFRTLYAVVDGPGPTEDDATRYKRQRDHMLEFIRHADVSSGVCCCGSDMNRHGNPMDCGHSPVDMWDYSVRCAVEEIEKSDKAAAIPDDRMQYVDEVWKVGDDDEAEFGHLACAGITILTQGTTHGNAIEFHAHTLKQAQSRRDDVLLQRKRKLNELYGPLGG